MARKSSWQKSSCDDNFRDQMHMYYRFKNADAAK